VPAKFRTMSTFTRRLSPDEQLLLHRHPHWKTVIGGILLGIVVSAAAAMGVFWWAWELSSPWKSVFSIAIGVVWLAVFVWAVVAPIVRWLTTHFAITNRRVIYRTGVFNTSGIDIPLARINSVQFRHAFWDRLFRTGTLIIESASDEPLEFDDIPQVESVHAMLYDELNDVIDGDDRD